MSDFNIIWLKEAGSTNKVMTDEKSVLPEGCVICASRQSAGRGQRGNIWESAAGENLTFSLLLRPTFLPVANQTSISQAVSLGIVHYLESKGIASRIKWPNDIYVGNRKICGILIENSLSENNLSESIVGIGLNVNQTTFSASLPNPTSMKAEKSVEFNLKEELPLLVGMIMEEYRLTDSSRERNYVESQYTALLYRRGEWMNFEIMEASEIPAEKRSGKKLTARILGIDNSFGLILEHTDGTTHSYAFKELKYLIND